MSSIELIPNMNLFSVSHSDLIKEEEANKVEGLVKLGIDVDKKYQKGETLLFQASARGNFRAVEILLEHNADPNILNIYGSSALYEAVSGNHDDRIPMILISNGAKSHHGRMAGFPILWMAAHLGKAHLIEPLISAGSDINEVCIRPIFGGKSTPLDAAVSSNNKETIDKLMSLGALFYAENNVFDIRRKA